MSKGIAPLDTIGVAAKLEDGGVSIGVRTRFTTAVDRVLGRYVDILHAHADGLEDRIRARNARRLQELEEQEQQPELAELVEHRVLLERARKDDNLKSVVLEAVEVLREDRAEAPENPDPIEDDWLNIFKEYAETASSERMRILWGRVLAGEARVPGAFSYATLRFISELDRSIAERTERAFSKVISNFIFHPGELAGEQFQLFAALEQRGLISGFEGMQNTTVTLGADGKGFFAGTDLILAIEGTPNETIRQTVMFLTEVGREVLPLLPKPDEATLIRELSAGLAKNTNVTKITVGRRVAPDRMTLDEVLYEKPQ